jgi:hypothetical protein
MGQDRSSTALRLSLRSSQGLVKFTFAFSTNHPYHLTANSVPAYLDPRRRNVLPFQPGMILHDDSKIQLANLGGLPA